jgi:hypothetical protein
VQMSKRRSSDNLEGLWSHIAAVELHGDALIITA